MCWTKRRRNSIVESVIVRPRAGSLPIGTAESDVMAAVDYVRANSNAIGVDPDRIGIWAFSGGGPLLSWCLRERPSFLKCLVAFYAMLDIRHLVPSGADAEQAERVRRLSPAAHLAHGSIPLPTLVARAGLDTPMINTGIDIYVRAMAFAGGQLIRR
jgi:acetyl esterase/lipase